MMSFEGNTFNLNDDLVGIIMNGGTFWKRVSDYGTGNIGEIV